MPVPELLKIGVRPWKTGRLRWKNGAPLVDRLWKTGTRE
jgi:hypothetical protein